MPLLKHHHPRMSSSCDPGAHQLLWQVYAKSGHNPPSSQLPIAEESQVGLNRQVWESIQTGKGYSDIFPSADPFWPCSAYDASSRCFSVLWQWYLMSCLVGVKDLSPLRHGPWLQVNGITPKLRSSGSSFGVKKFHQYLYGWKFTLVTDHKPLMAILGPNKGIPSLAAARLQCRTVLLSGYICEIQLKSMKPHGNADGPSGLPLKDQSGLSREFQEITVWIRLGCGVFVFSSYGWVKWDWRLDILCFFELRLTEDAATSTKQVLCYQASED